MPQFQFTSQELADLTLQFNDVKYAEADIYAMFEKLMNDAQHQEMFRPNYTGKMETLTLLSNRQAKITVEQQKAKCHFNKSY